MIRFVLFTLLISGFTSFSKSQSPSNEEQDSPKNIKDRNTYVRNNYKKFPRAEDYRTVIVHLNNWTYKDIKKECEEVLGPKGFAGVQISPVTSHAKPQDPKNPRGDERLSVANYSIDNESGTAKELKEMIHACNKEKVRVIIEVVLNNMMRSSDVGPCDDYNAFEKNKNREYGVCNQPPMYYPKDFHSDGPLTETDYRQDRHAVRYKQLDHRHDVMQLLHGIFGVPNKYMYALLHQLIDMGASGFNILNADHMWPEQLVQIYNALPDLVFEPTPTRPFIYSDVYDPHHKNEWVIQDSEYVQWTRVTDYAHAAELALSFKDNGNPLKYFDNWGEGWGLRSSEDSVVFTHTPMTQIFKNRAVTPYPELIKDRTFINPSLNSDIKAFKLATAFMLSHGHGIPVIATRQFDLDEDKQKAEDLEHRAMIPIISWRNDIVQANNGYFPETLKFQTINYTKGNENKDDYQVAYCVGNQGFVVFNNEKPEISLNTELDTCFEKPGVYCDVYSGGIKEPTGTKLETVCKGNGIIVAPNQKATFKMKEFEGVQVYNLKHAKFYSKEEIKIIFMNGQMKEDATGEDENDSMTNRPKIMVNGENMTSKQGEMDVNLVEEKEQEIPMRYRDNYKFFPKAEPYRSVIVHLSNWKYNDIKEECETLLGPLGYAAVQISPVTAHASPMDPNNPKGDERLSVANYKIENESGNADDLQKMITACNNNGVRVIIEVVLNNMMKSTENGPCDDYVGKTNMKVYGECGQPPMFYAYHFNDNQTPLTVEDYMSDITKVRTGELDGRHDLKQLLQNGVPNKYMYQLLTRLINMGAAGFKILNADHMDPNELATLFETLPDLIFEEKPKRPFIYSDVYEPYHNIHTWKIRDNDYRKFTRVTDYAYASAMALTFLENDNSLGCLKNWDAVFNLRKFKDSVVFINTPMTQIFGNRGVTPFPPLYRGRKFINPLDETHQKAFTMAVVFMLSHENRIPVINSNYIDMTNQSLNRSERKIPEHRWDKIQAAMSWRTDIIRGSENLLFPKIQNWQTISDNLVAYCLGMDGFVVLNRSQSNAYSQDKLLLTTCFIEPGIYCDVISGGTKSDYTGLEVSDICVNIGIKVSSTKKAEFNFDTTTDSIQLYNLRQAYRYKHKELKSFVFEY